MWTAIGTALLSAVAALGGVVLSSRLAAGVQRRQWRHEVEQKYRQERLVAVNDFVAKSAYIREACLAALSPSLSRTDLSALQATHKDLLAMATRLRLTAYHFSTIDAAMKVVDGLQAVIRELAIGDEVSERVTAIATLRLASARLEEEVLVSLARKELGLEDLHGMPQYDEDLMLKAFLRKALKDADAEDRVFEEIQQLKGIQADAGWLAR